MTAAGRAFHRIDARLFVLANNTLLLLLGMRFSALQRDTRQLLLSLVAGISTELVCAAVSKKHGTWRWQDRVLSALVTAVSTMILIRSDTWWFYGLLTALGILSKYLILDEQGRHLYNPTNFAIVLALAVLPDYLAVRPDDFSNAYLYRALIPAFGLLAALRGARILTTLGYYAAILAGVPFGHFFGLKTLWVIAPELNTSMMIFAFLMLTDPRTTPTSRKHQVAFGAAVGAVHLAMRYQQIPYSPFVALFALTMLRALRNVWTTPADVTHRSPVPSVEAG